VTFPSDEESTMKTVPYRITTLACLLGLSLAAPALAAPPPPPGGPPAGAPAGGPGPVPGPGDERMQRHMRTARLMGLVEELELDDAEALRVRGVMAKIDERMAPLRKQVREQVGVLRKAARGDQAAQKGVDDALKKLRELRAQVVALKDEQLQAVAQGLSAEKRARAALFLHRFHRQMRGPMGAVSGRGAHGPGPGMRHPGGPGMDPGSGPGMGPGPRWGGGDGGERPDLEILGDDD
jgi:hypothetical protein